MKKVSIKDVAREAGVSISTVSRVLNNTAPVTEELRERVLDVVEKLGYEPNLLAKGLREGRTKTIGFVIPDITNPFFSLIVRGAEDYLKRKGYNILIGSSDQSEIQEERLLQTLSKKVDGIIFTGTGKQSGILDEMISEGFKFVFLDRIIRGYRNISYVISDNYQGMKELIDYLIKKGFRSFYFINGEKETMSAQYRYKAFIDMMKKYSISEYKHIFSKFSYEAGYKHILEIEHVPDVVICGNDLIAYGAIAALEDKKLRVPDDVAVTGYDDIPFSQHYKPSLTTVKQPMYEMGKKAAEILFKMIQGELKQPKGIVLPNEFW